MNPIEVEIINCMTNLPANAVTLDNLLRQLINQPFGNSNLEFRTYPLLPIISKLWNGMHYYFKLWLCIEDYLANEDNSLIDTKLNAVEEALKLSLQKSMRSADKKRGTALFPLQIVNPQFIRNLYSLNDERLSNLFLKYLPVPRKDIFVGQSLPKMIEKREQTATDAVINVLQKNENDLIAVEKKLLTIQRKFRAKRRWHENLERFPYQYRNLFPTPDQPDDTTSKDVMPQILSDANKPYQPKCDKTLSERLLNAAKKIELFSTVSHLTSPSALTSIFNHGLLGRRSLIELYVPFTPASLHPGDIDNGDANVVCLGAHDIDPKAKQGMELIFDIKKIAHNNPCAFYKQMDFNFDPNKKRRVIIGDLDLCFSHTGGKSSKPPEISLLRLFLPELTLFGREYISCATSKVINQLFISDNVVEMHRILALNFFRFVDNLEDREGIYKKMIYDAISKLNDSELIDTLLRIGRHMTDSMEFNIYGNYQIDFSALLMIKKDSSSYSLNLQLLVDELKTGNLEKLYEVMNELPEIFKSYRFIDYLLSSTQNKNVISVLMTQRKICIIPGWLDNRRNREEVPIAKIDKEPTASQISSSTISPR